MDTCSFEKRPITYYCWLQMDGLSLFIAITLEKEEELKMKRKQAFASLENYRGLKLIYCLKFKLKSNNCSQIQILIRYMKKIQMSFIFFWYECAARSPARLCALNKRNTDNCILNINGTLLTCSPHTPESCRWAIILGRQVIII